MSSKPKILVADDSLTIRKLVELVLSEDGYEVITADSGADALRKVAEHKPALVLLDYILPDMQGTEVCQILVNAPDTWEIPVLLMSSNGNAIRQLYQDYNNVTDYITKPFAPNVLKTVVAHIVHKSHGEAGETSATPVAPLVVSGEPELVHKVNRLLELLDSPEKQAAVAKAAAPKTAKPRARRKAVGAPPPDALLKKFQRILGKHFRALVAQIPEWEQARGTAAAENYFLSRLLPAKSATELGAELMRATGISPTSDLGFRCPTQLLPIDAALRHIAGSRGTGELRIENTVEAVQVFFDGGEIVFITTNNPKSYCVGADIDFHVLPPVAIAAAVQAQTEQALPFFISLEQAGHIPRDEHFEEVLCVQGERTLARVFSAGTAVCSFLALDALPAVVKSYRQSFSLHQVLLACHRTIDDWFSIEQALPHANAALLRTEQFADRADELVLEEDESRLLAFADDKSTAGQIIEASGLDTYAANKILFRFIKLGLLHAGQITKTDDAEATAAWTSPVSPEIENQNQNTVTQ